MLNGGIKYPTGENKSMYAVENGATRHKLIYLEDQIDSTGLNIFHFVPVHSENNNSR
jgi:hypothetical protein